MPALHDPDLPAAADLTDPESARFVLQAAVGEEPLGPVTITGVAYRPGRRCLVRYRTTIGGVDARLVAVTGAPLPDGGVHLGAGETAEIVVWRFPDDPDLPGLAPLLEGGGAAALLEHLGVSTAGLELSVASYRPGRRAVVEARTAEHRMFCKVVRPHRAAALHDLHVSMSGTVPVPRSIGWSKSLGVVVLEAVPGSPVAGLLASGTASSLPDARDLIMLLEGIAASDVAGPERPSPVERVRELGRTVAAVLPTVADAVDEIAAACDRLVEPPVITAHRDFHASQLMLHYSMLRLVDIDTVGPGSRADDLAMMIAQLVCLGGPMSPQRPAINAYADALLTAFGDHSDLHDLATRVGAAIVGFATGPFRLAEQDWQVETARRMTMAVEWVRRGQV
jgi:hypothetical protein